MLPLMAHGHLIPFLSLARCIRRQTPFVVTLATTPLNLRYLRSTMSPSDADSKSASMSSHSAAPTTECLISDIITEEGRPPLCMISDVVFGWSVDIAEETRDERASPSTTSRCIRYSAHVSLLGFTSRIVPDAEEFSVHGFPERCRFHRSQLHRFIREADATGEWSKFFQVQLKLS
ncbi:hypothetical protein NL676_021526 [Syzygium grande]|nr:hypothetical protein NL676_021526 [Syzygium grande]